MGSKSSKTKRSSPVKTEAVTTPRIPQEIVDEILDYLAADSDLWSLRSCALVSRSWVPSSQRHLFYTTFFTIGDMVKWLKTFPVPEQSPAHYIKDLRLSTGGYNGPPEGFFEYTLWFTNVEKVALLGDGRWIPTFWRLPHSVTSLTINTDEAAFAQIQGIMAHLPNLDDLSLSGSLVPVDRRTLAGIGTTLNGRFGGRLRLLKGLVDRDIVNMLLEVPTGLHFTEVEIRGTHECLLPTVRLAEACAKTLVKLSYYVSFYYGCEVFKRSFDFSEFPSLQEVEFGVCWRHAGLAWIPIALSTLKPATSPRLSTIRLDFAGPSPAGRSVDSLIEATGDDLRWVADELARIEGEFEGGVIPTVLRDPGFKVALGKLNVLQH